MLKDNLKALGFAIIMCVICSVLISGAASLLRERQENNIIMDKKKNVLKALSITDTKIESEDAKTEYYATLSNDKIATLYSDGVKEVVINNAGDIQEGKIPADIKDGDKTLLPLYLKPGQNSTIEAYCIPIEGKGLWSTIKGYFAVGQDLNTVVGVTFYQQGETAGLGAEIATPWFQSSFIDKKILGDDGSLKSITIAKGPVQKGNPNEEHQVDGISGATMTGAGISIFIKKDLETYLNYFNKVRK